MENFVPPFIGGNNMNATANTTNLTDGMRLTVEALKKNGIDTIFGVVGIPVTDLARSFTGDNYQQDLVHLKSLLGTMGVSIPTLYKQYTELCLPGGVRFLDFNVDPGFSDCIDGLVVVDTAQLKPAKRKRYIEETLLAAV